MAVSADGSDVRELATGIGALRLDWSPDGSALLVSGLDQDDWKQTHVVRSNGSGFRTLDFGPTFFAISASWRPDGRHIAIQGEQEVGSADDDIHFRGLYLAGADGTNLRQLPISPLIGVSGLDWSPDGRHLSFMSNSPGGNVQVAIADIDEDGQLTALRRLRLDPESSSETWPKWSPDGSQLAVLTAKGSREQIAVVDPAGSGFRIVWPDVTDLVNSDGYFWSPDGRSLVITEVVTKENPDSGQVVRRAERTWILEVATGEQTEIQTPVESWQHLTP